MTTLEEEARQSPRSDAGTEDSAPTSWRTRWSRVSEVGISILVLAIMTTAILSAVPNSALKNVVAPVLSPVARATGLDQNWGMFAPNPPRKSSRLEVHVVMADGEHKIWRPENDASMPGLYWRKIKEEVIRRKEFRPGLASWVVRELTEPGERPVRVLMTVDLESLPLTDKGEAKRVRKLIFDVTMSQKPAGARP